MGNETIERSAPIVKRDLSKQFVLMYLLMAIVCILIYSQTIPCAIADSGGTTLNLNLQDVTQWLIAALMLAAGWILRKVDKNQNTLFDRVTQHDKEIYKIKGAIFGANDET